MDILWDDRSGTVLPEFLETVLTDVFARALHYTDTTAQVEISISYVTPEEIRQLNNEYRQKDTETDVLSFPFYDDLPAYTLEGQPAALGDIVICVETARAQAEAYGHSLRRELAFLALHGLLHLLGYDHEAPEEEALMLKAQEDILQEAGISR